VSFSTWLKKVTKREAADARDLAAELERKLNAELDRREQDLNATPAERLESTVSAAADADAEFDELAKRIRDQGR
jgi:DNA anti-recombination protein RmuC